MQAEDQNAISRTASAVRAPEIPDHELLRLIGCGAYGEVWMARNAIATLRAVKLVHRQSFQHTDHFEREFKGLLKFEPISRSHDGLVDVLQIGRRDDAGFFYYVMELADDSNAECGVRGAESLRAKASYPADSATGIPLSYSPRTLRSELQMRGGLAPEECVTLGLKLAAALEYLHAQGLVHRDIKPSNIIFVNGEPKLADIGLVTAIDEAHSLVGTVGYIPPEGPGTPQADLYSLGKVLYEMAFAKERQEFPQLPLNLESHPDYNRLLELNEIMLKACESDPRRRYSSAKEMQADLALLQHGRSVKQARTRERQWGIARKLGLAGAAVAVVSAALLFLKVFNPEYTPKPEALREYDLGRWFYNQCTTEGHKKAIEHLNKAVELDRKFLKPYGELVAVYVWGKTGVFADNEEKLRKTKELADKLLALDPTLAEGHAALSQYHFIQRDWRGAENEIVRAITLNPQSSVARDMYVLFLSLQGRAEEAQPHAQRSQELEPTARTTALVAAMPFFAARQFDRAIAQAKRVIELDKNFAEAHNFLGRCYEAQSNYLAAIEEFKTSDLLEGREPPIADYAALREAYNTLGQEGYLRKSIEFIHRDAALPESEKDFYEVDLPSYYARLGEKEKALDELEKNAHEGFQNQLLFEPMFDTLRDEPRFKALLKRAGLEKVRLR
jgi:serine/threonine protein kinase